MINQYKNVQKIVQSSGVQGGVKVSEKVPRRDVGLSPFLMELATALGIKFSKHALDRIRFRKIDITKDHLVRLASGIDKLRKKGVKEGIVVMDEIIAVVGVKESTVITLKTPPFNKDAVFSQIDGVVFV